VKLSIILRKGRILESGIEKYKAKTLFYFLSVTFFAFYLFQIPLWTSNADVLVYSTRSIAKSPILDYAFLDERSRYLLETELLPNYHLLHTIILWMIYQIVPGSLANSIWPSGFISAISGALIVGLTFLIGLRLELEKISAFLIAFIVGFIPSIWYHNLIGEVYALQLFFILFFIYFFLSNNLLLASLGFLLANLVTPVSSLSFSFLFIKHRDKNTILKAFIIGITALLSYLLIYYLININILKIFYSGQNGRYSRGITWLIYTLGRFLLLNFNFFIFYFIIGTLVAWKKHRNLIYGLIIAILPQLFLPFYSSGFLTELGSFQLPLFWILSFPIGLGLAKVKHSKTYITVAVIGLLLITQFIWINPSKQRGKAISDAGLQLKSTIPGEIKIIGHWSSAPGVTLGKYGWDFEKLSSNYIEKRAPTTNELIKIGEKTIIIVKSKKDKIRDYLSKSGIQIFRMDEYDPLTSIKIGSIRKVFENDPVIIYRWDKNA